MRGCIATGLETAGCAESAAAAEPASRLDRWMTGELDAREDHAVREHLSRCSACAREVAWMRAERALFDERSRFDPIRPPDFAGVMAAFERGDTPPRAVAPSALHPFLGDRRKHHLAHAAVRRDRSQTKSAVAASMSQTKSAVAASMSQTKSAVAASMSRTKSAPAASMIALGLCAAAALFCVLLPQQSPSVRVAPDVPVTRPARQTAAPSVAYTSEVARVADDMQAASLSSHEHEDGNCQPLASFDDGRERRAPVPAAPPPRDDDSRNCCIEDEQSAAGALICGPTEL